MMIRKGKLSDIKQLMKILNKTPELQGEPYNKNWVVSSIVQKNRDLVLVAEEKGKILGLLIAELWKKRKYSYLEDLWVHPKYRKRGIATKLIKDYEKRCRKRKMNLISGLVLTNNKKMNNIAKKWGFKKGAAFYFYEKRLT